MFSCCRSLFVCGLLVQVIGAAWYVASIQRQDECWKLECRKEMNKTHSPSCQPIFLDCESLDKPERKAWLRRTHVLTNCDAFNDERNFEFGMFADAFTDEVASAVFYEKYFYCLWFGLKSLRYGFCLSLIYVLFKKHGYFSLSSVHV